MVAPSKSKRTSTRVRISKSGQITLPVKVREQLGVEIGEQVDIVRETDGTVVIEPVRHYTAAELAGTFGPRSTELDVDDLIRESVHEGIERRVARWKD